MDPWLVLLGLAALAVVFVVAPVCVTIYRNWRRPFRLTCPRAGTEAQIRVAATRAAVAAVLGREAPGIERCSLWPTVRGCREECLALPALALRPVPRGTPPPRPPGRPGLHRILVPLDGSVGSERVLDAVVQLAHAHRATVRLVHVVDPGSAIRADDGSRVIAFADQETERAEIETRAYLRRLVPRLPGVTVEEAVRFGDPLARILEEAESSGADLIAMASHRRRPLGRLVKRSLARRLERETTIPVLLVPYEEQTAA
jgi:nucleotide-binding universal stress UspA family protein